MLSGVKLQDPLRGYDAVQANAAEIAQIGAFEQTGGDRRGQKLTAVRRGGDPGRRDR